MSEAINDRQFIIESPEAKNIFYRSRGWFGPCFSGEGLILKDETMLQYGFNILMELSFVTYSEETTILRKKILRNDFLHMMGLSKEVLQKLTATIYLTTVPFVEEHPIISSNCVIPSLKQR